MVFYITLVLYYQIIVKSVHKKNFVLTTQATLMENFIFCTVPMTWPQALESTLFFKIAFRNCWETAQLSKMLCDDGPLIV